MKCEHYNDCKHMVKHGLECSTLTCFEAPSSVQSSDLLEIADLKFLTDRASRTGRVSFTTDRDTGASSNSIVGIAYGKPLKNQIMPADGSDLRACENMWAKLPEHRKKGNALKAMKRARQAISNYTHEPCGKRL